MISAHEAGAAIVEVGLGSSGATLGWLRERHSRRRCGMIPMLGMDTIGTVAGADQDAVRIESASDKE